LGPGPVGRRRAADRPRAGRGPPPGPGRGPPARGPAGRWRRPPRLRPPGRRPARGRRGPARRRRPARGRRGPARGRRGRRRHPRTQRESGVLSQMADFTAKDVQTLRQATGAGMMDAKKALTDAAGDFEQAKKLLRERGLAKASDRVNRENAEGAIAIGVSDGTAALVELKCETDFVAKSDRFVDLTQQLADSVAAKGEAGVDDHKDAVDDLKVTLKENIDVGRVV